MAGVPSSRSYQIPKLYRASALSTRRRQGPGSNHTRARSHSLSDDPTQWTKAVGPPFATHALEMDVDRTSRVRTEGRPHGRLSLSTINNDRRKAHEAREDDVSMEPIDRSGQSGQCPVSEVYPGVALAMGDAAVIYAAVVLEALMRLRSRWHSSETTESGKGPQSRAGGQ